MGIFDNVTAAVNRGTEQAGRTVERQRLKSQINEVNKRRQQLSAQLGASLYDATRSMSQFREGREALYDGIAACDVERAECQRKIDELDAMAQAATVAATTYSCVVCGSSMSGSDMFCSGCGSPAEKARPAAVAAAVSGIACAACGAPMKEGDVFCMSCGTKVGTTPAQAEVVEEQIVEQGD